MLSDTPQIEMINGFGLYDKSFVDVLREIDDTIPFFKSVLNSSLYIKIVFVNNNNEIIYKDLIICFGEVLE